MEENGVKSKKGGTGLDFNIRKEWNTLIQNLKKQNILNKKSDVL